MNVVFRAAAFLCVIASLCSIFVHAGNNLQILDGASKLYGGFSLNGRGTKAKDPLLVRAARGEPVERVPVWIMRQAGRHMKEYRDLCLKHPTFRERSETVELSTKISMQPVKRYDLDGCILFSDILTPLPAMGIDFDILEKKGPVLRNAERWVNPTAINAHIKPIDLDSLDFVGKTLQSLRQKLQGTDKTLLGFVGLPFTLGSYMIEGGSSKTYMKTKKLMYEHPETAHLLFRKLADNVVDYVKYQIANGAQVVQLFDSWAGNLSPRLYKEFASHYHKYIISRVKETYPDVPLILFVHKGVGAFLDEMVRSGADIVNIDWTHNLKDIRGKINMQKSIEILKRNLNANGKTVGGADDSGNLMKKPIILQGNMDPMVLHSTKEVISKEVEDILSQTKGINHIMNLGHGIDQTTKEENVQHFVNCVKNFKLK